MIVPPTYFLDNQQSCDSIVLLNTRQSRSPAVEDPSAAGSTRMNYLMESSGKQFEVITLNRSMACNTTLLCNPVHTAECVLIHHRIR